MSQLQKFEIEKRMIHQQYDESFFFQLQKFEIEKRMIHHIVDLGGRVINWWAGERKGLAR